MRIRVGNLTMTNHPIHMHGHDFEVTGTDGGWMPRSARWPEVTTDVAVGQMRAIEFVADDAGRLGAHCHKSHHTMNAMGHDVPTMIGVDHGEASPRRSRKLVAATTWRWATRGMADMGDMEMPLPDNTLPMMTGHGPFGADRDGRHVHRREGARGPERGNDYGDPGWYQHPRGQRGLRMARRAADASERAAAGAQGRNAAAAKQGCAQGVSPQTRASPLMRALTTTFDDQGAAAAATRNQPRPGEPTCVRRH